MRRNKWASIALILAALVIALGGWLRAQNRLEPLISGTPGGSESIPGWAAAAIQVFIFVVFGLGIAAVGKLGWWVGQHALGMLENDTESQMPDRDLETRFARGDITWKEFEDKWHALHV